MTERISLKSVKIIKSMSEETYCYTATVCLDGKPVMLASNRGQGGADDYHRHPKATAEDERALILAADLYDGDASADWSGTSVLERVVGDLLDAHERDQQYRRWCKKSVVFQVEGDDADRFRTLNTKYDPTRAADYRGTIEGRYPGKKIVILNERFA